MSEPLLIDGPSDPGVIALTLNRPFKRNALNHELVLALIAALEQAGEDRAAGAIILAGSPPAFCAGLDLEDVFAAPADRREALVRDYGRLLETLEASPRPIVAAVRGDAAAGGAGLLLKCDIVVAADSATVGFPGILRGLVAGVLMPHMLREFGPQRSRFLMLGGTMLSAEQAEAVGIVHETVAPEHLDACAGHWARRLAGYPRRAVELTRRALADLAAGGRAPAPLHIDRPAH